MPSLAQNIVDLIGSYVDKLRTVGAIASAVDNGDGSWTITASNISDLVDDCYVSIGTEEYRIYDVDTGAGIYKVLSSDPITATKWKSLEPYYYHGTPMIVEKEIQNDEEALDKAKYSAVILWEVIRQDFNLQRTNIVGNEARLILSFLDTNNRVDWTPDQHYDLVIDKMEDFADSFIQILKDAPEIALFNDYTYLKHVNWGTIIRDSGHNKYILDDNLSGLNLEVNLPIKRGCLVDGSPITKPQVCAPASVVDENGALIEFVPSGGQYVDEAGVTAFFNFPSGSSDSIEISSLPANAAGTYENEVLVNVATVTYEIDTGSGFSPATLPFSLAAGNGFRVSITRTASGNASVEISS